MYVLAVQNQKLEAEHKQKQFEKDLDDFIKDMKQELENIKGTMVQSLNKKVDYSVLDTVKDSVQSKVDQEYFQNVCQKLKGETLA